MKAVNRMRKIKVIAAGLAGGFVLSTYAVSLLTNGSFEDQTPVLSKPAGWATTLDGTYWAGCTADSSLANSVYKLNSVAAADGDFYIRRIFFAGSGVTTTSVSTVAYNLSDLGLPGDTIGLALKLDTMATSATADVGKFATYGSLVFYSGVNGTGAVLGSYDTDRLISSTAFVWQNVAVTAMIPEGAQSCAVFGRIAISSTLASAVYGARFDGFDVSAVANPVKLGLYIISTR